MTEQDHAKLVENAIKKSQQKDEPCILCNAPTRNRGLFVPDNYQEFGAPKGKARYIVYPLCDLHEMNDGTIAKIENILILATNNPN